MPVVGIIGAGTMGTGIAQTAATCGWNVRLADVSAEAAERGLERIRTQLQRLVDKQKLTAEQRAHVLKRIQIAAGPEAVAGCELVIEAVVEDLSVKAEVLRRAATGGHPDLLLASNTSSLSITALGQAAGHPARTVGMHFFNPVPLMPLVEVIAGRGSAPEAVDRAYQIALEWGKTPVRAKDTPGFIVNRVARGYYLEPLRLLDEGIAGVDELDQVLRMLGGFRMGPFELMDLIGIDVNFGVSCSVWEQLGRPARLAAHPIQKRLVEAGHLGRKTKQGFYSYQPERPYPAVVVQRRSFDLPESVYKAVRLFCDAATEQAGSITEQYAFARTLAAILNEAGFALDEDVASPGDIDAAMKLGTNYPRGPVEWAERIGRRTCRFLLEVLNETMSDGRFAPSRWMQT